MSDTMWGGRFTKAEEKSAQDFNASISFDCRMYREDIAGSLAHAAMLANHNIISRKDLEDITSGLKDIRKQIDDGKFEFSVALEDIHMNVEKRLTEAIGDAGARLHTARSRNDQAAVDTHMYVRRQIGRLAEKLIEVEEALLEISKKYQDVILPGYTHLQRAQPVLFAHHMLAYFAMLERDFRRLEDCFYMADMSPLGACALAVALVMRFVPVLLTRWRAREEAWKARTRRRVPLTLVAAFLADILQLADHVAEALDARGFDTAAARPHSS